MLTVSAGAAAEEGMFSRIAIVNRGEAAMRAVHAIRELEDERRAGIRSIALHTEAEQHAMFARQADEAVVITGPGGGIPYLDHSELERALLAVRADAAWVGWGFVAEDPAFADLCERMGVVFVGPPGDVMRRLGDKIGAKLLAERVGVPVAPWSGGAVDTVDEARAHPTNSTSRSSAPALKRCGRSATRPYSSSGSSPAPATSRFRCSRTRTGTRGRSACATARFSGATRS
jgi:pyruvate carboxylase